MSGVLIEKTIAAGLVDMYHAWRRGRLAGVPPPRERPLPHDEVLGKLDETLTAGSDAKLSVWAGQPPYSEQDTTRKITVYARLLETGSIAAGTWVFARVINGKWQAIKWTESGGNVAIIAEATLTQTMLSTDTTGVSISGFSSDSPTPFTSDPDPVPTSVYNSMGLSAPNGAKIRIYRFGADGWEVFGVTYSSLDGFGAAKQQKFIHAQAEWKWADDIEEATGFDDSPADDAASQLLVNTPAGKQWSTLTELFDLQDGTSAPAALTELLDEVADFDASPSTDADSQVLAHTPSGWKFLTVAEWITYLGGYTAGNDQSIGHDADDTPAWQDDGSC